MKKIDDYYNGEMDGARKDYYPAFCRAQNDLENTCILFNGGTYYFSHTIEIIRTLKLLGSGASYLTNTGINPGFATGTVLEFPPNIYGIILHSTTSYYNRVETSPNSKIYIDDKNARNPDLIDFNKLGVPATLHLFDITVTDSLDSIIQDLMIKSTGEFPELVNEDQSLEDLYLNMPDGAFSSYKLISPFRVKNQNAQPNGITMLRKAHLQNVVVYGFAGNGIFIHGFVSRETEKTEANTDFWSLQNVGCYANFNDGLRIFGSDAHFGIANKVQCLGNLGWGITDISKLGGNTFINCHCEGDNFKGDYLRPSNIMVISTNPYEDHCEGASVYMNCYDEGERSNISNYNIIINGHLFGPGIAKEAIMNKYGGLAVDTKFTASALRNEYIKGFVAGIPQPKTIITRNDEEQIIKKSSTANAIPYRFVIGALGSNIMHNIAFSAKNYQVNLLIKDNPYFPEYVEKALNDNSDPNTTYHFDPVTNILTSETPTTVSVVMNGNDKMGENHIFNEFTEIQFKYSNHFWQFNTHNSLQETFEGDFNEPETNEESPLKISSRVNMDIGDEQLWLEKGFYLGIKANRVNINAQPTKPTHTAVIGDVVYNKNPIAGDADQGYAGWIFCNDETWHPFGAIVL